MLAGTTYMCAQVYYSATPACTDTACHVVLQQHAKRAVCQCATALSRPDSTLRCWQPEKQHVVSSVLLVACNDDAPLC